MSGEDEPPARRGGERRHRRAACRRLQRGAWAVPGRRDQLTWLAGMERASSSFASAMTTGVRIAVATAAIAFFPCAPSLQQPRIQIPPSRIASHALAALPPGLAAPEPNQRKERHTQHRQGCRFRPIDVAAGDVEARSPDVGRGHRIPRYQRFAQCTGAAGIDIGIGRSEVQKSGLQCRFGGHDRGGVACVSAAEREMRRIASAVNRGTRPVHEHRIIGRRPNLHPGDTYDGAAGHDQRGARECAATWEKTPAWNCKKCLF